MHANRYDYYSYEGYACRVQLREGREVAAELYRPGTGFVEGPLRQITDSGRAISKQDFDKLVLAVAKKSND